MKSACAPYRPKAASAPHLRPRPTPVTMRCPELGLLGHCGGVLGNIQPQRRCGFGAGMGPWPWLIALRRHRTSKCHDERTHASVVSVLLQTAARNPYLDRKAGHMRTGKTSCCEPNKSTELMWAIVIAFCRLTSRTTCFMDDGRRNSPSRHKWCCWHHLPKALAGNPDSCRKSPTSAKHGQTVNYIGKVTKRFPPSPRPLREFLHHRL